MGKWLAIMAALLVVLPSCGSQETPTRQNDLTPLTSITISASVERLPVGVSIQLTATGNYSGLFTRDVTDQVTWSSASANIADFSFPSSPGRIKAFLAGPASITATLAGVASDSFHLTVSDAVLTALAVTPLLPSLPLGKTQTFTVQGSFSDTTTSDLSADVLWSSSDVTVATISNDQVNWGAVTTFKMGTTTISAQFGSLAPASTTLTVTAAALSSIEVTPASSSILSLATTSLTAIGTFSDATTRDITTEVTWESSDPAVATMASANIVRALTPGKSIITATLKSVIGTADLKVTGGSLQGIEVTLDQDNNIELVKDTVRRITARGIFSNDTSRDITGAVTWAIDSATASVTPVRENLAQVQALAVTPPATPVKISASYGNKTAEEISLSIIDLPLTSVLSDPLPMTLGIGASERLTLSGMISPSNSQYLTFPAVWSSANPAVATVDTDGRVHAVAAGSTVITGTFSFGEQPLTTKTDVTVPSSILESLTLSAVATPASMIAGREVQYTVSAIYRDGFNFFTQDVTADAAWTCDNANVAKFSDQISDPGLLVAVDAGTATLTATFGGKQDTETLTVSQ